MRLGGRYICHTTGCLVGHVSKVAPGLADARGIRIAYVPVNPERRRKCRAVGRKLFSGLCERRDPKVGSVQARGNEGVRTPCESHRWLTDRTTAGEVEADVVGARRHPVSDVNWRRLAIRPHDVSVVRIGYAYHARLLHQPNGGNIEPYFCELGVVKVKYERPCRNPVNVRACGAKSPERAHAFAPEGIPRDGHGVRSNLAAGPVFPNGHPNDGAKKEKHHADACERQGIVGCHFDRAANECYDCSSDDDRDWLDQVSKHPVNKRVPESFEHLSSNPLRGGSRTWISCSFS